MLILGHSFVKRLKNYLKCNKIKMHVQNNYVQLIGFGGVTVLTLRERLTNVNFENHSKVILQIGGNDLCSTSADEVVRSILDFASYLIDCGIDKVVVCTLFYRGKKAEKWMIPKYRSYIEYNQAVDYVSNSLKVLCKGRLRLWKHNHNVFNRHAYGKDQIHLNEQGMEAYRKSVLGALKCH